MSGNIDLSLDGLYRAVVRGLQVGLGTVLIFWLLEIVFWLPLFSFCPAFVLGTLLGTAYTFFQDTIKISLEEKGVLVTGCDTGFGHSLALQLADLGAVVFAGCLKSQEGGAVKLKGYRNIHVVQLDITSDEEVTAALNYVSQNLPSQGLWGIVNNAGWSTFGHVEWMPIPICRKSLEVNVWGMMRIIRTFLPLIRQSEGRIVNMSSGMGRRCAPSRASYCITKYGVEALSDCLRFEMRHWNVNVIIVEPGNFINATGVFTPSSICTDAEALWKQIPESVQLAYTKEYFDGFVNNMIKYSTSGETDKQPVLDALINALVHQYPHPRYQPMDRYFKLSVWVNTHLPEWVFETLFT